jgi:hypothetical protein
MKHPTEIQRRSAALAGLALLSFASQSQLAAASDGTAAAAPADLGDLSALRRLGPIGSSTPGSVAVAAAAGYGFTEAVLGRDDRHHRVQGTLAAEWAALATIHLGLRLGGRYDRHQLGPAPGDAVADPGRSDDGWTGEPQINARWAHTFTSLASATQAGLALRVNLPGARAPSIDPGAIGAELIAQGAHGAGHFGVTGALGYRLDRSAHAVPPPDRLSSADRVSLGVNGFDAVVVGLAVSHRRDDLTLFAEAAVDALIGAGHPPASQWPMRVGVGARHPLSAAITGELATEICPSARPSLAVGAPLVDVPPRVTVSLGLLWTTRRRASLANPTATGPMRSPLLRSIADGSGLPPVGQLRCSVRSFGGVGISATLKILKGPDVPAPSAPMHSRDGTFSIELAPGTYEVLIEAAHFIPQRRTISVEKNGVTLLNADLRRAK